MNVEDISESKVDTVWAHKLQKSWHALAILDVQKCQTSGVVVEDLKPVADPINANVSVRGDHFRVSIQQLLLSRLKREMWTQLHCKWTSCNKSCGIDQNDTIAKRNVKTIAL